MQPPKASTLDAPGVALEAPVSNIETGTAGGGSAIAGSSTGSATAGSSTHM
jgi:hypothetical protein